MGIHFSLLFVVVVTNDTTIGISPYTLGAKTPYRKRGAFLTLFSSHRVAHQQLLLVWRFLSPRTGKWRKSMYVVLFKVFIPLFSN